MAQRLRIKRIVIAAFLASVLLAASNVADAERLPLKTYTSADGLGSGFLNDLMRVALCGSARGMA